MLVGEVFDEAVGVVVYGLVEGVEGGKIVPIPILLISHVVSNSAWQRDKAYEEVVIIWYYSHLLAPFCDRSSMGV